MTKEPSPFTMLPPSALPEPNPKPWLIEDLWPVEAVGILAGPPKVFKTWVALDMAVAVASGGLCINKYQAQQGSVLYFPGEGRLSKIKERLVGITTARSVSLADLPLHILDNKEKLILDNSESQDRLEDTIKQYKPSLVILDPFRRLFEGDENNSQSISKVLNFLTRMQKKYGTAIVIAHHSRKEADGTITSGSSLRGSSDLYSWGESFLFLSKKDNKSKSPTVLLETEHRDETSEISTFLSLIPSASSAVLNIVQKGDDATACSDIKPPKEAVADRLLNIVRQHGPLTKTEITSRAKMNKQACLSNLNDLLKTGALIKTGKTLEIPVKTIFLN